MSRSCLKNPLKQNSRAPTAKGIITQNTSCKKVSDEQSPPNLSGSMTTVVPPPGGLQRRNRHREAAGAAGGLPGAAARSAGRGAGEICFGGGGLRPERAPARSRLLDCLARSPPGCSFVPSCSFLASLICCFLTRAGSHLSGGSSSPRTRGSPHRALTRDPQSCRLPLGVPAAEKPRRHARSLSRAPEVARSMPRVAPDAPRMAPSRRTGLQGELVGDVVVVVAEVPVVITSVAEARRLSCARLACRIARCMHATARAKIIGHDWSRAAPVCGDLSFPDSSEVHK